MFLLLRNQWAYLASIKKIHVHAAKLLTWKDKLKAKNGRVDFYKDLEQNESRKPWRKKHSILTKDDFLPCGRCLLYRYSVWVQGEGVVFFYKHCNFSPI